MLKIKNKETCAQTINVPNVPSSSVADIQS